MTSATFPRQAITPAPPPWRQWRLDPPTSAPSTSTMLAAQSELPKLPVPALDVTLEKVLKSAKAVVRNEEEWVELERKAKEFGAVGGVGQELQKRLEARRDDPSIPNWIAEWWDTDAYMAYRDSVVVNVSYYFGFRRLPQAPQSNTSPPAEDPSYVAASLVSTAAEFRRLVAKGLLEPEKAGKDPLCMESYKWAFNACRVPAKPSDYAVKIPEDAPEAQFFIAIRKGHFWRIPLLAEDGSPCTVEEFKRAFDEVYRRTDQRGTPPGVGILTGVNRDLWAEAHVSLMRNGKNAGILQAIRDSAFVVALDEASAKSEGDEALADFSRKLWKADEEGINRWWDKPLQWVVFQNGEAGFIGEHSCMDGTPTARMNDFISKRLLTQTPTPIGAGEREPSGTVRIEKLPFVVDAATKAYIDTAKEEYTKHVGQYKLFHKRFGHYGKDGIKAMKTSPDGWVQMMFQLAYYLTNGETCGTYEAAQVRRFAYGRTETVRTATVASRAFTHAMVDPKVGNLERAKLFREAVTQQGGDVKMASAAMGVDRHLFGLRHLLKDGEKADFLSDPLLARSSTWTMSTSQIYIENAPSYGWGPVAANGLALPYMIHNDNLQFTVTCHQDTPGDKFLANLEKAGLMLMETMQAAAKEGL